MSRPFLDTSVLLGGLIEMGPGTRSAHALLDAVAEGKVRQVQTAWHCCLEFYAVSTRLPEELRLEPADALRLIESEILSRLKVHQLPEKDRLTFLRTLAHDRIAGGRTYDAHIAEIARTADARIVVTENRRHFTSLLRHSVRVLTADEFMTELGA